jgi:hypothetical protein
MFVSCCCHAHVRFICNTSNVIGYIRVLLKFRIYYIFLIYFILQDNRLCGLVVRVFGYRSGGPSSIPGTTRKKVVGPLSLVNTTEELLHKIVAAPV